MAIAVPTSRPVLARRVVDHEQASKVSAFLMLSLLLMGLAGLIMVVQAFQAPSARAERTRAISPVVGALPTDESVAPSVEQQAAAPVPAADPAPAGDPAPASVPAVAAAPTLAPNAAAQVANTDGLGVILYTAPRTGARSPRGLLEGARVTVVEASGSDWIRVRAANGLDGWVPTRYLAAQ